MTEPSSEKVLVCLANCIPSASVRTETQVFNVTLNVFTSLRPKWSVVVMTRKSSEYVFTVRPNSVLFSLVKTVVQVLKSFEKVLVNFKPFTLSLLIMVPSSRKYLLPSVSPEVRMRYFRSNHCWSQSKELWRRRYYP